MFVPNDKPLVILTENDSEQAKKVHPASLFILSTELIGLSTNLFSITLCPALFIVVSNIKQRVDRSPEILSVLDVI